MNKTLVFATFALSFILAASLAGITSKQMALAVDLSSIKQKATDLLAGNNNNNTTNNNSTSAAAAAGHNSPSSSSSSSFLKQQATNAIGNIVKQ